MNFIIQYSICSLILYALVIYYNLRIRKLMNFQNNVFLLFAYLGMFLNAFDLLRCVVSIKALTTSSVILYLINEIYYLTLNVIPICFLMYCFALVDFFHIRNNIPRKFNFILVPLISTTLFIVISPFFRHKEFSLFYIMEGTSLIENGKIGYLIFYVYIALYMIGGFNVIWHYRKTLNKGVLGHLILALNLMTGSLVAQFLFPYARVISLALSMFTLDISFYIQRSDDVYNNNLECLNKKGFIRYLDHLFVGHQKFYIYSIILEDADFYHNTLGDKDKANLETCIVSALKSNYRNRRYSVYRLRFGSYALIARNCEPNKTDEILDFIRSQISIKWGYSALDLMLSFRVCQIESQTDVLESHGVSDLISYFAINKKFAQQIVKANELEIVRIHTRSYIESCILKGLKENRFEVYYQPIYSIEKHLLTGAEALVRLKDDDGNFVSPEEFIPIAEQNGTIFEIGKFVFTTVCKNLSEINLNDFNIQKVDINLSVIQCIQEDMYKQLIDIRNQFGIPSSLINIEITETASTNSPDVLLKNMNYLQADGIELSLDDYGSGNSNISYILNLPFRMIKIDKSIVWKGFENTRAHIVLKSTIDMIKSLGLLVLAEGVETEEQAKHLQELGCEYLQGYYYSRPLPLQQFLDVMKK